VRNTNPNPNLKDLKYKIQIRWIPILAGSVASLHYITSDLTNTISN